jgi:RNA polymerase sigma-70 factor (ECF subfamily)
MDDQRQPGVTDSSVTEDDLDREDMRRLVAGGDSALNNLMERHNGKLMSYLLRLVLNEEDTNDLAQETFVRVYLKRNDFDPRRRFSSWLYAIATNLARDRLRWRRRHPELSMDAEDDETGRSLREILPAQSVSPAEALFGAERAQIVQNAISELPENWRIPLILAEFEGRSHIEIGEILSCTPKAVEMRIARARKELRQSLASLMLEAL